MGLLSRFSRGELRLNRIEALSDGVFAIIVTLLVLELRVPAGSLTVFETGAERYTRLSEQAKRAGTPVPDNDL
jgi:Endosomal/lysosomal potassium channel TMEM175